MTLFDLITGAWAIQPEMLSEIRAIYATHLRGEKIDISAVEARLGRPLASEQQAYTVLPGGVAVLRVNGVMAPKMNMFMEISGGMSMQLATKQLESATADARVLSTVLLMDTPGGSVIGTPEFAASIHELAAIKPIVTLSDGALASAGYWAGAAANAVLVSGPTVQVGSIGIVGGHKFDPRAAEGTTELTAGKYKRITSGLAPLSEEGKAYMQADLDYVYSLFVDAVATYRGASTEQVLDRMADGRVFRGQQAIDAGLADGMSTLDALVEQMATDPAKYAKRRKASFSVPAALPSKGPPVPKDKQPTREKGTSMSDPITRASFQQEHAALYAELQGEFTGVGATQERSRIQAVLAVGADMPGHEKLLEGLAFDGKTSGAEAAQAVLKAEGAARQAAIKAHKDDAPAAAPAAHTPAVTGAKTKQQMATEAQAYAKNKGIDVVAAFKELGFAS